MNQSMPANSLPLRTDPSGQPVSLLGFGCMRLPLLPDSQQIDETSAAAMVDYALAHGINYFDTAWPYHGGTSEGFIGRALAKHPRDSFLLADKLPTWEIQQESDVVRYLDLQLARCGVDYFDYYLIHNLGAENFGALAQFRLNELLLEQKRAGKIRRLGFSLHASPAVLTAILESGEWDFVQIQLNYLDWELQDAKRLYAILSERGLPVVVMEPVRGGALAALSPPANALLQAEAPDTTAAALALRFAASLPGVLTVLSGMSTHDQLAENIATMRDFAPLTDAEHALLERVRTAYLSAGVIPCTGCRYCIDCPYSVDIPRIFAIYNQYRIHGGALSFVRSNEYLAEHDAHACANCGNCLPRCPQGIDIPARLAEIAAELAQLAD